MPTARTGAVPHAGSPAAVPSLPLLLPRLNVWVVFELGPATENVADPKRHRTAVPTAAGQVTRIPTATVTDPPEFGHRTAGLPTDTELPVIHPVPPLPVPGMVMK